MVQRGHSRGPVFFGEDDYHVFLHCLKATSGRYGCSIHAYVLMTNHYHLLVSPPEARALPAMIQALGRLYVRHVNGRYGRSGTLWEGRYKASLVDAEDYLFTCMRYIENNPVRARMVRTPQDYPWSSHGRNAFSQADGLILSHRIYVALGDCPQERAQEYRALFPIMDEEDHALIRAAERGGWVIGKDLFGSGSSARTESRQCQGSEAETIVA